MQSILIPRVLQTHVNHREIPTAAHLGRGSTALAWHSKRQWCYAYYGAWVQQTIWDVQVKYLAVIPLIAAQLVKNGDFLAPSYPQQKYGYGCILYDHFCSTATAGTPSGQHRQQTSPHLLPDMF